MKIAVLSPAVGTLFGDISTYLSLPWNLWTWQSQQDKQHIFIALWFAWEVFHLGGRWHPWHWAQMAHGHPYSGAMCCGSPWRRHTLWAVNLYRKNRFHFPTDSNRHVPPKCCLLNMFAHAGAGVTATQCPELGGMVTPWWQPQRQPSARVPNWNKHRDWRPQPALPQDSEFFRTTGLSKG